MVSLNPILAESISMVRNKLASPLDGEKAEVVLFIKERLDPKPDSDGKSVFRKEELYWGLFLKKKQRQSGGTLNFRTRYFTGYDGK